MRRILVILALCFVNSYLAQNKNIGEQLAQAQLDAYNKHDIEAFLSPYSDSVEIYNFPNKLQYKGKAIMRKNYGGMFISTPDLFCTLKNRIAVGNTIIDQESVVFQKDKPAFECMAIYTIENGKIAKVHFIVPKKE
jgi:hypothetical protein